MSSLALANVVKSNPLLNSLYMLARDVRSFLSARRAGTFAQHGEDLILPQLFPAGHKGTYLDIGASHPFRISNTYLLYARGWRGVAVDPIPHFRWLYRLWRPQDTFLNVGVAPQPGRLTYHELTPSVMSTFSKEQAESVVAAGQGVVFRTYDVDVVTPNAILEAHFADGAPDFLSVDVESLDFDILSAIDFARFRPKVIAVEFNSPESEAALTTLLEGAGYDCGRRVGCNILAIR